MAQSFHVPTDMINFAREYGLTQTGPQEFTEFYVGETMSDLHTKMDARAAELSNLIQAEPIRRAKIGRNATCPCGSGRKFKKCCISHAQDASA